MNDIQEPWRELLLRPPAAIPEVALAGGGRGPAAAALPLNRPGAIPRIKASELTYERFCRDFMEMNTPLIVQGVTQGWRAAQDWVLPDGGVNLDFLQQRFGSAAVMVTDTARAHEGSGPCKQMLLSEYIAWWRQHSQLQQQQQQEQGQADGQPLWYCKDWHLASEFPQYQAYRCPPFFQDDWLNEWCDARAQQQPPQQQQQPPPQQQPGAGCRPDHQPAPPGPAAQRDVATSDYRFVYLGPAGTCTPLHSDVLRSFSWSANVAGRKRWRLLPPWHAHLLLDRLGRTAAWDFFAEDPEGMHPRLAEARQHLLTLVQQPGEAIFVPSGWWHTVENLDDCASINHNWLNGHNAHWAWALLRLERRQAAEAIDDCRQLCSGAEFEGLVQRNLGANAGLDYSGLGALLRCVMRNSLRHLAAGRRANAAAHEADGCVGGWGYHAFRLQRAAAVMRELAAEQQRIMDSSGCGQPPEAAAAAPQEWHPHAAELAANRECLAEAEQRLRAMAIELPVMPPDKAVWR